MKLMEICFYLWTIPFIFGVDQGAGMDERLKYTDKRGSLGQFLILIVNFVKTIYRQLRCFYTAPYAI
jgi:hypothetical protein